MLLDKNINASTLLNLATYTDTNFSPVQKLFFY